ncbi:hypothetical protein HYH03_015887 [Edaphochlamys debaryana]|uniref:Uncharacterized protein n=1 Tax=Edaphochlamys debaryana TaxID=47281 RepID=A0A835XK98_9CHLO|nr:hypothetical protein HYH03_015887 [Edaphochlamys debaryana]|eukprot:KAG2485401.1 hypothetical protein HYH03_015887 [Edaphochlamys debaryana]
MGFARFMSLFKGFKTPADAYILAMPVAYACVAFCVLSVRPITSDPETSTFDYYNDESKSASVAQRYDNEYKTLFRSRVANHRTGVFTNWFEGTRQ